MAERVTKLSRRTLEAPVAAGRVTKLSRRTLEASDAAARVTKLSRRVLMPYSNPVVGQSVSVTFVD